MKNIILFVILFFITTLTMNAQCVTAPWLETFTTTSNPTCWTQSTTSGGPWVYTGNPDFGNTATIVDHTSGVSNNYAWVDYSATDVGVILQSPEIDITALTVPQLRFWLMSHNNNGSVTNYNLIHIEANDGAGGWLPVGIISGEFGFQWIEFGFDVSSFIYGANLVQIRFRAESGGDTSDFDNDLLLDDVSVVELSSCFQPYSLTATSILNNSANLLWSQSGTAAAWNVEYGPQGFTPGTGTMITGTTNNPEPIAGLIGSTTYDFYVQTDCGGGILTAWSGPASFTTLCDPIVAPWIDDVESMSTTTAFTGENCWLSTNQSAFDWNIDGAGSTPTTSTGPSGAYSGSNYFYVESTSGVSGDTTFLLAPLVDVSSLTVPALEFYYHMYGANTGTLGVQVWDGVQWILLTEIIGEQQTSEAALWLPALLDLSAYSGNISIRFYAIRGAGGLGDISLDNIAIIETPSCPIPTGLIWESGDETSASFSWTENGSALEWELEYGAVGFTQGMGTFTTTSQNPETIIGLTANNLNEVYVRAICGPGDTSDWFGPVIFNTFNQGMYMVSNADCPAGGFIDISSTGAATGLVDDGETGVTIPFSFFYQNSYMVSDVTIGNNGGIILNTLTGQVSLGALITGTTGDGLYPFWDDFDTEDGDVYYETVGTPGNQIFIVQWEQRPHFSGIVGQTVTFQVQIEEATGEIYFVYEDVEFGGTQTQFDFGLSAGIGVAGPNQDIATSSNNATYLQNNSCAHYYYTDCPNPENYTVSYTTFNEAGISWSAGLANEMEWTIIYGLQGFDPLTGGTTVSSASTSLILSGLDDAAVYDVYIYADCDPGVIQSEGFIGQFSTLPNCADVTGLAGITAVDSIFTTWNFTENAGFPVTEFAIEYGMTGFSNGTGNYIWGIDVANYSDTLFDSNLIGGGLYDIYLQSVCGTDSSYWVGPITVMMPLTNDSTCLAEELSVDGTIYTFSNNGASVAIGESAIAPISGACDGNMTWCNSSITASTWFTFTAPSSGNVRIDGENAGYNGQIAIYETSNCANFSSYTLIGANDDSPLGGLSPFVNICGLTPGNTYYLMHDPSSSTGVYSLRLQDVMVEAGADNGLLNICIGDTVDLSTQLSGADAGGFWTENISTANFNDPIWASAGLASQVFTFEYKVVDGCAVDSVETQVEVYGLSSAGNDGSVTICLNEQVDLLSALSGNVDLGGTWYDPSNNPLPNSSVTGGIFPGSFNYDYITGNGVCLDDTANVVLIIDGSCDIANIQEIEFKGMELYPNPTSNVLYISNVGSTSVYNYSLTTLNGKVITSKNAAVSGTEVTGINVENLETGVYLLRVFNENIEKTFRVVKQ